MIAQCPPSSRNMQLGGVEVRNILFLKSISLWKLKSVQFFMAKIADVLKNTAKSESPLLLK